MKASVFCIIVVFALVSVSFAQKPHDITMSISVTGMEDGWPVEVHTSVINTGSKGITIREVELYCGTSDQKIWESIATYNRVTVKPGEVFSFVVSYSPSCADDIPSCVGDWSLQGWMCFGGSGKTDLMTPLKPFTVY